MAGGAASVYSGSHVVYVASAASVGADLCVLTGGGMSVKVTNIAGTAPIFFTVSHQGGACPLPSVNGSPATYVIAGSPNASTNVRHSGMFGSIVQVTSTGTTSYMIEVQGQHATS